MAYIQEDFEASTMNQGEYSQATDKGEPAKLHILFVCGKNLSRSPTAERLYRRDPRIDARSADMSEKSPHQISEIDIRWADLILVMEADQKSRLLGKYRPLQLPAIESLDIPDEFEYMDPELITILRSAVEAAIKHFEDRAHSPK